MKQLIAELDGLAEDMGRDGATGVNTVASASQQLARLERENAALREQAEFGANMLEKAAEYKQRAEKAEGENAELREDKERMNFLQRVAEEGGFQCFGVEDSELLDFEFSNHGNQTSESVRAAIDAARKEAQP